MATYLLFLRQRVQYVLQVVGQRRLELHASPVPRMRERQPRRMQERPVEPLPVQPGGPELLAGALMPQATRRAARWADGISSFSFGPTAEDVGARFETARAAWKEAQRERPPRLVTGFWFALGNRARTQLETYLERYLAFMGPEAGRNLAPHVTVDNPRALRAALRMVEDLGADEVLLVPTTSDTDEIDRVVDALAL